MKIHILALLIVYSVLCAHAQPLLIGSTGADGSHMAGTILHYTGGDSTVSLVFDLPANPNNTGPASITLTEAPNGLLYGLATDDGPMGQGTLYEYNYTANTYTVRVTFDSATGYRPEGSLLLASNGLLYGLTSQGDSTGGGILFSYVPGSSSITRLVTLPPAADPIAPLIQAANGKLYGLTQYAGTDSSGTIFSYDIGTATYTTLYSLPSLAYPSAALVEAGADTLYGLTTGSGADSGGTLFRYIADAASDTVLYSFPAASNPMSALVRASDGLLYGLTSGDGAHGHGTLFSYDPATGTYTDRWDFGSGDDGTFPEGSLLQASDGHLYGMTYSGGANGGGTIFEYSTADSTYTKMFDLTTISGDYPGYGGFTEYFSSAPAMVSQPDDTGVCPGTLASFTATASVSANIQWQVSIDGGSTYSDVPGASDTTYSFIADVSQTGYAYRAVFTNALGSDTSAPAVLAVNNIDNTVTVSGDTCVAAQSGAIYQWVVCGTHQSIASGTSQTLIAPASGSYQCIVVAGPCIDSTNCVTVSVPGLGISDVSTYHFALYPDPTQGTFTIDGDYAGTLSVQVISLLGEKLREFAMTGAQNQFDISSLAPGVYQVQISDGQRTLKVLKVVKE